ncbi:MAG: hypothetical protein J6Z10_01655, partial [Prevotella sp.]|nr:hypothetical protein [Prevotella sp.]
CFFDQRKRLAESAITQKNANKILFLFPLNRNFGFAELTHVNFVFLCYDSAKHASMMALAAPSVWKNSN